MRNPEYLPDISLSFVTKSSIFFFPLSLTGLLKNAMYPTKLFVVLKDSQKLFFGVVEAKLLGFIKLKAVERGAGHMVSTVYACGFNCIDFDCEGPRSGARRA